MVFCFVFFHSAQDKALVKAIIDWLGCTGGGSDVLCPPIHSCAPSILNTPHGWSCFRMTAETFERQSIELMKSFGEVCDYWFGYPRGLLAWCSQFKQLYRDTLKGESVPVGLLSNLNGNLSFPGQKTGCMPLDGRVTF